MIQSQDEDMDEAMSEARVEEDQGRNEDKAENNIYNFKIWS